MGEQVERSSSLLSDESFSRLSPTREGAPSGHFTRGQASGPAHNAATSSSSPFRYTSGSPSRSNPSSNSPQRLQQLVTSQQVSIVPMPSRKSFTIHWYRIIAFSSQKRVHSLEQENKELEKQLEESVQLNEQMGEQVC
jgi:hypothetical protein